MKKIFAAILVIILLSVSIIALADDPEKIIDFDVSFQFKNSWRSIDALNGFLEKFPISRLILGESQLYYITKSANQYTGEDAEDKMGFGSISLTGERDNPYRQLFIFQFYTATRPTDNGMTLESVEAQLLAEHPDAIISERIEKSYGEEKRGYVIVYAVPYIGD